MGISYYSYIWCKNKNCQMYDERQVIKYKSIKKWFANPENRRCSCCNSDTEYSSALRTYTGMTVKEAIEVLSKFNQDAILVLSTDVATCPDGACFESIENYPYEMFEYDTHSKVQIFYSPDVTT